MSSLSDQLGFNFRGPERRVWKVRDLVAAVRTHIEREYSDAWVEGEISNFRAPESGHLYFTLKDGNAQIRVVMFRSSARLLRFRPADGLQVVVRGRVTVYEDRGELQISAEYIEPKGATSPSSFPSSSNSRSSNSKPSSRQKGYSPPSERNRSRRFRRGSVLSPRLMPRYCATFLTFCGAVITR